LTARRVSIERIGWTTVFLTVALALLCAATGAGDAASVLFGGLVSVVNLRLIRLLVSRLMTPDAAGARMSSVVATKFLVLLAILAVALGRMSLEAASFLLGAGTLFAAILLDALLLGEPVPPDAEDGNGNA